MDSTRSGLVDIGRDMYGFFLLVFVSPCLGVKALHEKSEPQRLPSGVLSFNSSSPVRTCRPTCSWLPGIL